MKRYLIQTDRSTLETVFEDLLIRLNELSVVRMSREDFSILMLYCNFDLEKYVKEVLKPNCKKEDITYMANCSPLADLEDKLRDYHKKKKRSTKQGLSIGRTLSEDDLCFDDKRAPKSVAELEISYHERMESMPELRAIFDSDLIRQDPVLHEKAEQTISLFGSMDRAYTDLVARAEYYLSMKHSRLASKTIHNLLYELQNARAAVESKLKQDRFAEAKAQLLLTQSKDLEGKLKNAQPDRGSRAQSSAGSVLVADRSKLVGKNSMPNFKHKDGDDESLNVGDNSMQNNGISQFNHNNFGRSNTTKTPRSSQSHIGMRGDLGFQRASTQQENKDMKNELDESVASIQNIDQSDDDIIIKNQINAGKAKRNRSRKQSILIAPQAGFSDQLDLNKRFAHSTRPRRMSSLKGSIHYNEAEIEELFSGTPKNHALGNLGKAYLLKQQSIREHSRLDGSSDSSVDEYNERNRGIQHTGGYQSKDLVSLQHSRLNSAKGFILAELGKSAEDLGDSVHHQPLEDLGTDLSREVVLEVLRKKNLRKQREQYLEMQQKASNLIILNQVAKNKMKELQSSAAGYLKTQKIEIIRKLILDNKLYKIATETLLAERQKKEKDRQQRLRAKVKQKREVTVEPKTVDICRQTAEDVHREVMKRDQAMLDNRAVVELVKNSASKEVIFSRVNNRIRFEIDKNEHMKSQLKKFLVLWLHDLIGMTESKELVFDSNRRAEFFRDKPELLDIALDALSYRPSVYKFATEFIFEKTTQNDIDFDKVSHNEYQKFSELREKARPFMLKTSSNKRIPRKIKERPRIDVKPITDSYSILDMNFNSAVFNNRGQQTPVRQAHATPLRQSENFRIKKDPARGLMTSRADFRTSRLQESSPLLVTSNQLLGGATNLSKSSKKSTARASRVSQRPFDSLKSKFMAKNIDLPICHRPADVRPPTLEDRIISGNLEFI